MRRRPRQAACDHIACTPCHLAGRRYGIERIQWHAEQDYARVRRISGWTLILLGLIDVVAALAWAPVWWATIPGLALGAGAMWAGWRWAR